MNFTEKGMTFERLDDHRKRACKVEDFDPKSRSFIILSDAHKWDRGEQDYFAQAEPAYLAALNFYHDRGFTLVLLGDIEEGAGDLLSDVLAKYPETFSIEKSFPPDRYIRIYGNHDHDWKNPDIRKYLLEPIMGRIVDVWPALVLGDRIMVVHGHEGDVFSDELHGVTQIILRLFKKLYETLRGGSPSAAENSRIRNKRARLLYKWGRKKGMIVIAGHTHLAYFESVSLTRHVRNRIKGLEESLKTSPQTGFADINRQRDQEKAFMIAHDRFWEKNESLPEGALPLYFNTGCCKYEHGLTGIEISGGELALIRWTAVPGGPPVRTILDSRQLNDIRTRLKFS